ncbi:CoA-binding protein [Siccirubricoccus deserti]
MRDPATLRRLLSPRSVAIVGVSADPIGFGARSIGNMRGFAGPVWAVNPKYAGQELHGFPCYGSIAELPEAPDCALLALPRQGIMPAVEACIEKELEASSPSPRAMAKPASPSASPRRRRCATAAARPGCRWWASIASASSTMC